MRLLPLDGPPLVPSPERAHHLLRRELLRPEYQEQNPIRRLLDWLDRTLGSAAQAAGGLSVVSLVAVAVIVLLLLLAIGWLLSRLRRDPREVRARAMVGDAAVEDPREVRRRAEAALAEGRHDDAVVEGFRALALREAREGRIDAVASATAAEVALALGRAHPTLVAAIDDAARRFEAVLYGHRPATAEQAHAVLDLDLRLAGARR